MEQAVSGPFGRQFGAQLSLVHMKLGGSLVARWSQEEQMKAPKGPGGENPPEGLQLKIGPSGSFMSIITTRNEEY